MRAAELERILDAEELQFRRPVDHDEALAPRR
jgi:hypothetical protein